MDIYGDKMSFSKVLNFISKKRQIFIVVFICSIGFNLYVNKFDFRQSIPNIFFQFFGSLILSFVFTSFLNIGREKSLNWLKSWLIVYILMVGLSLIMLILGIYPME